LFFPQKNRTLFYLFMISHLKSNRHSLEI
jgi:hypothetical protein